jgi:hypothetical protein
VLLLKIKKTSYMQKGKKTEKKGINGKQTPSMSEDFEML